MAEIKQEEPIIINSKHSVKEILELIKVIERMSLEEFHLAIAIPQYRGSMPSGYIVSSFHSMKEDALKYFSTLTTATLDKLFDGAEQMQLINALGKKAA